MGIALGSNFTVNTALPLDDRTSVANLAARDAIPVGRMYDGLKVFVQDENKNYQYVDSVWVELPSVSSTNSDSIINALIFG